MGKVKIDKLECRFPTLFKTNISISQIKSLICEEDLKD